MLQGLGCCEIEIERERGWKGERVEEGGGRVGMLPIVGGKIERTKRVSTAGGWGENVRS